MEADDDRGHHNPDDQKAPGQDLAAGLATETQDPADAIAGDGSPDRSTSPPFPFVGSVAAVVDDGAARSGAVSAFTPSSRLALRAMTRNSSSRVCDDRSHTEDSDTEVGGGVANMVVVLVGRDGEAQAVVGEDSCFDPRSRQTIRQRIGVAQDVDHHQTNSASIAICLPGIASRVKRAATSATRSGPWR